MGAAKANVNALTSPRNDSATGNVTAAHRRQRLFASHRRDAHKTAYFREIRRQISYQISHKVTKAPMRPQSAKHNSASCTSFRKCFGLTSTLPETLRPNPMRHAYWVWALRVTFAPALPPPDQGNAVSGSKLTADVGRPNGDSRISSQSPSRRNVRGSGRIRRGDTQAAPPLQRRIFASGPGR